MKTFNFLASACFVVIAATPAMAQITLPTPTPTLPTPTPSLPTPGLLNVSVDLSTGQALGNQQVLTAIANVGGPSLVDVYLGLLTGATSGGNTQLLNPSIIDALNTVGGPTLVSAFQSLIGSTARNVDYVNGQINDANQSATTNVNAATTATLTATAAAIGNSYSMNAAARAVADVTQGNTGTGTSTLNSALASVNTATQTAASIGNSASFTSPASVLDLSVSICELNALNRYSDRLNITPYVIPAG